MKKQVNNLFYVVLIVTSLFMGSCSNEEVLQCETEKSLKLASGEEGISIKIGSEFKTEIKIAEGGGEYNAFSVNPDIAIVELSEGNILVEGVALGKTNIVVSDKNCNFVKCPIAVYVTDEIELETTDVEFEAPIGRPASKKISIVKGNGGYEIFSDNPKISASVDEEGVITITGSAEDVETEITAILTLTDQIGLTASINVKVSPSSNPYTDEQLEEIMKDNTTRYYFLEYNDPEKWWWSVSYSQKIEGDNIIYGWEYYSYLFKLSFKGDNSVGKKENGIFNCSLLGSDYSYPKYTDQTVNIEIIKNDNNNIWGVFSFIDSKDNTMKYGYFCDKIAK